jgi:hypothetical protein
MSVFQDKRRNKRWSYDFWLAGQRYQGYCVDANAAPVSNRREALDCEAAVRTGIRKSGASTGKGVRPGAYTLNQACLTYLARKQETEPSNFDNHVVYVREIRTFFNGSTPAAEISSEEVERYRSYCGSKPIKIWTGGPRKKKGPGTERFWKSSGRVRSKRQVNNYLKCLRALFGLAGKVRDPHSGLPAVLEVPDVRLHKLPKRVPRPIGDEELSTRIAHAPQWTREAAELSRLYGLRKGEVFWLERRHIDRDLEAIRFGPNETKSRNEELAHGGQEGWQLLLALDEQADQRRQRFLVTWPGKNHFRAFLAGKAVPDECWQPLKSIRKSWQSAARRAGIDSSHRFHDVRARYITEVAKIQPAAAQDAARHQDPSTTALYIKLASTEVRSAVAQAVARRPTTFPRLKVVK